MSWPLDDHPLARSVGVEPTLSALETDTFRNVPRIVEREGLEPSLSACKTDVLPLTLPSQMGWPTGI